MDKTYKIIEDLCRAKGISVNKLCVELRMRNSVLSDLKSGRTKKLSTATLQKIANYFSVPVDYLLDLGEPNKRDIPPEPSISESQFLFALYGEVPEEIDAEDIKDIKKYAEMVRLRKLAEKKGD